MPDVFHISWYEKIYFFGKTLKIPWFFICPFSYPELLFITVFHDYAIEFFPEMCKIKYGKNIQCFAQFWWPSHQICILYHDKHRQSEKFRWYWEEINKWPDTLGPESLNSIQCHLAGQNIVLHHKCIWFHYETKSTTFVAECTIKQYQSWLAGIISINVAKYTASTVLTEVQGSR